MFWAKPDDGWAYSKVELAAIWNIPSTTNEAVDYRLKRWHHFSRPEDEAIRAVLESSMLSEFGPQEPIEVPVEDRPASRTDDDGINAA